ncbi:HAD family hydrolase [Tardisphaera miroshnichenkoae]
MIKAVVFDMDGTLVDSKEAVVTQLTDYSIKMGRQPLPRDQLIKLIGKTDRDIARTLVGDDEELIDRAINWFNESHEIYYGKLARLFPGVEECLRLLKEKGYRLGIASNATTEIVRRFLRWSELGGLIEATATADQVQGKPAPDMILKLAREFGVQPSEVVYVGDTTIDVIAGRAAGAIVAAVSCGVDPVDELSRAKPDLLLPLASWLCRALRL